MQAPRFQLKGAALYYAFSLGLLCFLPVVTCLTGDANLPPLEPLSRLLINTILINAGLAYAALLLCRAEEPTPRAIWFIFLGVALAVCAVPPVFSGDLYEYLIRGRIFGVYHQNPYAHASGEFPQDVFFSRSVWHHTPENYGPAWVLIQWIMPTLFGQLVPVAVFTQKILFLGFLAASGALFFKITSVVAPDQAQGLTRAFVLNPNLWVQNLLDGHNDIVMVFWMLLAVLALLKERTTLSFMAATMGALVKFTSGILLFVLGIYELKSALRSARSERFRTLAVSVGCAFFLAAFVYAPFWIGADTLSYFSTFKDWFYSNSVPYAFYAALGRCGIELEIGSVKTGFMVFFAVNVISALWTLWKRPALEPQGIFRAALWMFLALYASYAIPFYGNHFVWATPFLILSQAPLAPWALFLFSMAGMLAYFKRLSFLYLAAWALYLAGLWVSRRYFRRSVGEAV